LRLSVIFVARMVFELAGEMTKEALATKNASSRALRGIAARVGWPTIRSRFAVPKSGRRE
jgi:hypothetical protein